MAKQTITKLICDVGEPHDGTHTVKFTVQGSTYEVDVCDKHGDVFDKDMAKWMQAGTKAQSAKKKTGSSTRAALNGIDNQEVRRWAAIKGIEVPKTGRIRKEIVEQYQKEMA